jgi:hypothetical protein
MHVMLRRYIRIGLAIAGASVLVAASVHLAADRLIPSQPAIAFKLQALTAGLSDGTGPSLLWQNYPTHAAGGAESDIARQPQTASLDPSRNRSILSARISGQVNVPGPPISASLNLPTLNSLDGDIPVVGAAVIRTNALVTQFIFINVPINLANVIAAAVANPKDIPGLLSFMVHCLLLPEPYAEFGNEYTLLYRLTAPIIGALATVLPPPIGSGANPETEPGLILTSWKTISDNIKSGLSALPEAVFPAPTFGNVPPPVVPITPEAVIAAPTFGNVPSPIVPITPEAVFPAPTVDSVPSLIAPVNSKALIAPVNSKADLRASQTQRKDSKTDTKGKGSDDMPSPTENPRTKAANTDASNTDTSSENHKHPKGDRRDESRKANDGNSNSGKTPARNASR